MGLPSNGSDRGDLKTDDRSRSHNVEDAIVAALASGRLLAIRTDVGQQHPDKTLQ